MNTKKLRLGVLIDSLVVPSWIYHSLEWIVNSNCSEVVVLLVRNGSYKAQDIGSAWNKKLIYRLFNRIDEYIFQKKPDAFALVDLAKLLGNIQVLPITPVSNGNGDEFTHADVKKIRQFNLDILIKMGSGRLHGDVLTASRYGVWFYEHRDNRTVHNGPPGFWEVIRNQPETGLTISIAGESPGDDRVIYRSRFMTYKFSPARNRNTCFWASVPFMSRQIELLHRLGETNFLAETEKYNSQSDGRFDHQYPSPSNFTVIKHYVRLFTRQLTEINRRFFLRDNWFLLFSFSGGYSGSFCDFQRLEPPKDRFWADPHLIEKDGKYFVFIEEYLYKLGKGHISVIEMTSDGRHKDSVPVIERDYHLSYPFVFEFQDHYYLIPESASNDTIDLYECTDFPTQWKFKLNLMKNVKAVDTTLFFYHGKWWMFTGLAVNEGALPQVELHLFYSDDLFTDHWDPHPGNPVNPDVISARPAGKIFDQAGRLYRPSQDCSRNYGYGFIFNQIDCLTENMYSEKQVDVVKPDWDPSVIGTHTYSSTGSFVIIDGFNKRSRFC